MLNNSAAIIGGDNQLENGVVHLVDKVVTPSQKDLPELIGSCQFFKIFASALNRTGFADSLKLDNDENWDPDQYKIQREFYGNYVCAPPTKFYKFTGFVEPDEVFHKNGIYTIDDLTAFAENGTEPWIVTILKARATHSTSSWLTTLCRAKCPTTRWCHTTFPRILTLLCQQSSTATTT